MDPGCNSPGEKPILTTQESTKFCTDPDVLVVFNPLVVPIPAATTPPPLVTGGCWDPGPVLEVLPVCCWGFGCPTAIGMELATAVVQREVSRYFWALCSSSLSFDSAYRIYV